MTNPTTHHCRCGDTHPVPTDAGAYRVTEHFQQRLTYRSDPAPDSDIVQRCFAGDPKRGHTGEEYRYFDAVVDGVRWRVVVALKPAAFHDGRAKHRAVTICAPDHHERDLP